jgi:hypothetical protein
MFTPPVHSSEKDEPLKLAPPVPLADGTVLCMGRRPRGTPPRPPLLTTPCAAATWQVLHVGRGADCHLRLSERLLDGSAGVLLSPNLPHLKLYA